MLKIKRLEKKDINQALKIITETRAATKIKEARWLMELSLKKGFHALKPAYYVLFKDDKIIGISGLYQDYEDPEKVRWLDYLAVTPKLQRQGYGTVMLGNLEKICRNKKVKLLCVFTDNQKAINFYKKHKFKVFGNIPNYFEHSDNKVWLCKKL
jgi:ribosomal protein S18 acetylase RimI-like enzyme